MTYRHVRRYSRRRRHILKDRDGKEKVEDTIRQK